MILKLTLQVRDKAGVSDLGGETELFSTPEKGGNVLSSAQTVFKAAGAKTDDVVVATKEGDSATEDAG